jgi:hypothetical protein
MKRLRLIFLSVLTLIFGLSYAAEVTVPSGDTLQKYIDAAAAGDVLILEDGGIYDQDGTLTIDKSLTIKGVDGYTVRPAIIQGSTNGIRFGEDFSGAEIVLTGIEFLSTGARYLARLATNDSLAYLEMSDIVAHGYDRCIIRASDEGIFVDSVLISNSHFYDFNGSTYRLFYFDKDDCPVKYFKAVNSSFVDFDRTFLQMNSSTEKTVIVENCNIHRRSNEREDDLFDIDGDPGTSFTLSNSIISSILQPDIWDIRSDVTDSIMNVYYFDIEHVDSMLLNTWSYEAAFVEQDPLFSNGPAGALYLDPSSPALTASTTGGPIGDPRWVTAPGVATLHKLSVSEGVLSPLFKPDVLDYTLDLPYGTASVEVEGAPAFAGANVAGLGNVDVSSGSGTATVVVTAADGITTQTYTVAITVALPSTDATLSELMPDVGTLEPAFDPGVIDYTLNTPWGTDTVFFDYTLADETATAVGTDTVDVQAGSGTATFVVTAQDGTTTITYTVEITIAVGIDNPVANEVQMYYNRQIDQLMISNSAEVETVEIYSLTGALVASERVHQRESLEISTDNVPDGLYVVRLKLGGNKLQTGKFAKY